MIAAMQNDGDANLVYASQHPLDSGLDPSGILIAVLALAIASVQKRCSRRK